MVKVWRLACKIEGYSAHLLPSLIHCFWECFKVQQFWSGDFILQFGPKICLLGLMQELLYSFKGTQLLQILLHCARKCILLQWIMVMTPPVAQWKIIAKGFIPNEAYSTALRDKPFRFHGIWDPFLKCLGVEVEPASSLGIKI